ncbi:sugar ABC transporter substrate-binding protein [Vibrio sinensis]|uniref:Sugar ABC transporter substrate-binding protein n=1 Tax=Vibrio sinensis TaxID=2302434 RepID=A0A3A6QRY0_9VIBR|nr:sugar ABC transporter substrate-binding protein [Vibrio sinensis]RJX75670.1 sugar ABC transporter substrate-binding protein [Vibrio sinensis]
MKKFNNVKQKCILATLISATSFSFNAYAETELNVWWIEREQKPLLEKLDEENPNIKLNVRLFSIDELNNELLKAASTGRNIPDIVQIDNPYHQYFASLGVLADLNPYIAKSDTIKMEEYFPGPKATVMLDGKAYGLPSTTNSLYLYYNKDAFKEVGLDPEQPPQTWTQLREYAEKLTDHSKMRYGLRFSFPQSEEGVFQSLPWLQMVGADWNNLEPKAVEESLGFLKGMIDDRIVSRDSLSTGQTAAPFMSQTTAILVGGPWMIGEISQVDFEWGAAVLPYNEKYNIRSSALGGINTAIPAKAENIQAAFELLEDIRKHQDVLWNDYGNMSPVATISSNNKNHQEVFEVLSAQLESAKPRGPHPEWSKISPILSDMTQRILTGRTTAEQAAVNAEKRIEKIVDKS